METKLTEVKQDTILSPIDQTILNNIDNLKGILTFTELEIIAILKAQQIPLTTKEIRNRYMSSVKGWLHEEKRLDSGNSFFLMEKVILKDNIKNFIEEHTKLIKKKTTRTEYFNQLEKLLKSLGIRIPSYKTFYRTLETLRRSGIVGSRPAPDKKSNELWFFNPKLRKIMEEKNINFY